MRPRFLKLSASLALSVFTLTSLWITVSAQAAAPSDESCLSCHADSHKSKSLVDSNILSKSVHADLECVECHDSITAAGPHKETLPPVNCAACHEDEANVFKESVHGTIGARDQKFAVSCKDCHGTHEILPKSNPRSMINPQNLPSTCGNCHSKPEVINLSGRRGVDPVKNYLNSVHGRLLRKIGKEHKDDGLRPPTCIDCHGGHDIYPRLHPKARFNKINVAHTCGKCHKKESDLYQLSIHWQSVKYGGNYEAPVCFDCHGEHTQQDPTDKDHNMLLGSSQLCVGCHSNVTLMVRFGLDGQRLTSYLSTYHGLATQRGSPQAAKCVSCHEVHDIRSRTDPLSTVNPRNLIRTCGKCHKSANENFVKVSVHPINQRDRNPIAWYAGSIYMILIVLGIGGMVLHNLIIFVYYIVEKHRKERQKPQVQRFRTFDLVQHSLLAISFIALAITGFALKYPDAIWVRGLSFIGLSEPVRAFTHRFSACVLVLVSIIQVFDFMLTRHGRSELWYLCPRWSDVTGFVKTMAFYLRLRKERPEFPRYDYAEKVEYLALIWGTIIMTCTGFILWFPEHFLKYLPVWSFELAEVVHYYEALLAVFAILVWHFFFVIFHPERYPMSTAWIDGKEPQDEGHENHEPEPKADEPKPTCDKDGEN